MEVGRSQQPADLVEQRACAKVPRPVGQLTKRRLALRRRAVLDLEQQLHLDAAVVANGARSFHAIGKSEAAGVEADGTASAPLLVRDPAPCLMTHRLLGQLLGRADVDQAGGYQAPTHGMDEFGVCSELVRVVAWALSAFIGNATACDAEFAVFFFLEKIMRSSIKHLTKGLQLCRSISASMIRWK